MFIACVRTPIEMNNFSERDIVMLAGTSGKERTVGEYRALLASGGFRLSRTVTCGDILILEALPDKLHLQQP